MDKIALITGANKGIGLEISRQLGRDHGFIVLLGARDAGRGQEAVRALRSEGVEAHFLPLSVREAASIEAAARQVESQFGRLDVLVNNAGIARDGGPPSSTTLDMMRETYETNVFAPIAIINAFLPLLRRAPAARIVNVSSGLGSLTQHSDPSWEFYEVKPLAYGTSKTALNAVTVHFAHKLRGTPVKVNAADPGYTATDLNGHSGPRTVEQGAAAAVRLATLGEDGPSGQFFDEDGPVPW